MISLSAAILARDEERHIAGCLASLASLTPQVVVLLDEQTVDGTELLARRLGATVQRTGWRGFPAGRNLALTLCRGEWVLFIDADERVTPRLASEIRALLQANPSHDGYWIPRYNLFFGYRLRGGGWYPDHQLRLLRRNAASYDPQRLVHEYPTLRGTTATLKHHLVHHNIDSLGELWHKQRGYALAEAQTLYLAGQQARRRNFLARPVREFTRRFLTLGGWRDGLLGCFLATTMAWFELLKFVHLDGLQRALDGAQVPPLPRPAERYTAQDAPPTPQPVLIPSRAVVPAGATGDDYQVDLAVVIVSWNVSDLLHRCLASVEASLATGSYHARVIVVDNDSSDGSAAMVREVFPAVELIEAGRNLGFAAANNLALTSIGAGAAAYLLLNPDTAVHGTAIADLLAYLHTHPEADIVGPQLRYGDGSIQSSRRRFPTAATFFWESTLLEQWWPTNPWARHYHYADAPADQVQRVDWLVGAALLVRRSAVERAGLLDDGFFLYSEELEWQWRISSSATAGGAVIYLPQAQVTHYEGRSSSQVSLARHTLFQCSKIRLARMHYGPTLATCLRLFLLVCYAIALATELLKWILGHKRALRRQRLALYRAILRDGLHPRSHLA